jgi:hypothetical protein
LNGATGANKHDLHIHGIEVFLHVLTVFILN